MAYGTTTGWLSAAMLFLIVFLTLYAIGLREISNFSYAGCSEKQGKRQWSSTEYCSPATNVFFLKTHKCASSTVQNILMRFGDTRNLAFALPKDNNYIGHPEPFSKNFLPSRFSSPGTFNILCHHLRLDIDEVRSIMVPEAKFITIVRDPVTLFESMYDYYNITGYTGLSLQEFVLDKSSMRKLTTERMNGRFGRNQMLFDMGFYDDVWDNDTLIQKAINKLDQFFDLVMISEMFEESLILLKHQLCWNMEDIVYLIHNKRSSGSSHTANEAVVSRVKDYNRADQVLYEYFLQKLNRAIDEFGRERMNSEVNELRLWNSVWRDHCVRKLATSSEKIPEETKAYSSKVYSFVLKDGPIANICRNLAIEELQYTQKLRSKQMN